MSTSSQIKEDCKEVLPNKGDPLTIAREALMKARDYARSYRAENGNPKSWRFSADRSGDDQEIVDQMDAALAQLAAAGDGVGLVGLDDARLALWQAINNITIGNRDDDKLILEEMRKLGFWVCRLASEKEVGDG